MQVSLHPLIPLLAYFFRSITLERGRDTTLVSTCSCTIYTIGRQGQRAAASATIIQYQSALSTSPYRCWDQCACRPPSPSSGRCRSVGGRAGCAAQAWRWQVRGQAQSVRPGGACDKGAVDRGTSRWLAPVDGVVHPPAALLHAHATPLRLGEQPPLGCILGDVFGQDDVAVRGGACEFARSYPQSVHQTPERGWGKEGGAFTGTQTHHRNTSLSTRSPGPS